MKDNNLKYQNRRKFINNAALIMGGSLFPFTKVNALSTSFLNSEIVDSNLKLRSSKLYLDFSTVPNFCSHEHWGSISSIGMAPEQGGFRCDTTAGAQPLVSTSIWDLVLEPYQNGWMHAIGTYEAKASGSNLVSSSYDQLWKTSPSEALNKFKSKSNPLTLTGGFQCTRRGILHLYGIDISNFRITDIREKKVKKIVDLGKIQ